MRPKAFAAPARPELGSYFTPEDVATRCGWTLAYVYKQARQHGWKRVRIQGRVFYWGPDVERTRKDQPAAQPGVNPFTKAG